MLYNHHEIIVYVLLLPVVLNILLPMVILAVWMLKKALIWPKKPVQEAETLEYGHLSSAT